jgi:hypothetical protein
MIVAGSSATASAFIFCKLNKTSRESYIKKLGMLLAITILVIGLGFYRGWFILSRPAADPGSNKMNINLAANPDKMKQDAKIVKDKASTLTGGARKDIDADGQTNDVKSK